MRPVAAWLCCLSSALAALAACGCGGSAESIRIAKSQEAGPARGTIVLIPGVEGGTWQLMGVRAGLRDAGIDDEIVMLDWETPPFWSIVNLTDLAANRRRARRFADRIAAIHAEKPDRPLSLLGFSGGGGLALMTLECLADGIMVDRLVLCAAAISPEYDLSGARGRVRERIINIYSPRDGVVGWGTATFGTIDRRKCVSAGHCGFLDASRSVRKEPWLEQISWEIAWQEHGHYGGHVDYLSRRWARAILAPLLKRQDAGHAAVSATVPAPSGERKPGIRRWTTPRRLFLRPSPAA